MQSRKKAVDSETQAFQRDLLRSVKEMNAGKAANKTKVKVPLVVSAGHASGLSQAQFASVLGISVRTLQKWEQGERELRAQRRVSSASHNGTLECSRTR